MPDGRAADLGLERLLHVLPSAMRDGGARLDDLAASLDTDVARILEDLEELTDRVFYQPGGWPDDVHILLDEDRLRVLRASGFERPVRLSPDETLCLALALRGGPAASNLPHPKRRAALLARVEAHLSAAVPEAGAQLAPDEIATPDREPDPEGIRETVMEAARERRPCAIWYAKPGAPDGTVRVVHPYAIAYAEGRWYTVAHCTVEGGTRVFRMDRMLAADVADGLFEVPESFDVDDYLDGGRVFDGRTEAEVRIRYSARIARWIRESGWGGDDVEESGEGAIVVRHRVADPGWAVGHVLLYGGEAEIIEPASLRGRVVEVAEALAR